MTNEARIQAALAHAAHRPCLICSRRSEFAAVWVPTAEYDDVFEQQPGERTSFGYALCEGCKTSVDVTSRVQAKLVEKWGKRE